MYYSSNLIILKILKYIRRKMLCIYGFSLFVILRFNIRFLKIIEN